jgi:hypothetical protein
MTRRIHPVSFVEITKLFLKNIDNPYSFLKLLSASDENICLVPKKPVQLNKKYYLYHYSTVSMKKLFWILAPLIWIVCLIILIIAFTNPEPYNPLREYRLVIGIGFICVSGFIRILFKKMIQE